jgi:midasin (ATPase involved in ribosome maturation)
VPSIIIFTSAELHCGKVLFGLSYILSNTVNKIHLKCSQVIPYIASEFRKDKIWLRRTRPSKRTYQVVLALDDSSSMADNHSKEVSFGSYMS